MKAVITGASSGIGEALARRLANGKAELILVARRADRLDDLASGLRSSGNIVHVVPADLEQPAEVLRLAAHILETLDRIEVVVHNAGRGHLASVEDTSLEQWRRMFALNVDAPYLLTQQLLPRFRKQQGGHLIFVSSMAGKIGYPYNAAYVAAKHALVGFVAGLRSELIGTNIHATVVCPSGVASEWGDATDGGSINDLYAKAIPRSREIARDNQLPLAPLKKLISSDSAAQCIVEAIERGRSNDVYTHDGTEELAVMANVNRMHLEDQHRALWLAMTEIMEGR
ncbi:MAG: SDR family NAD(P)-dependent oxidoreductase [Bradyrhizobiaceae bacterium]|nr:SDR family NAD(P)-dependent oxidoreductase [Bradyrhizobiaceae bacterium]